jgi:hypothetical protein
MKKLILIIFVTLSTITSNCQTSGGHAIKIVEHKEDSRPYPVKVFNQFIDWLFGR